MRKALFAFIVIFIISLFIIYSLVSSADPYFYDYEDMKDRVVKIEIVEFDRLDDGSFDITLLKILSDGEVDELLKEISLVKFKNIFGDPREPLGNTLKLYFINEHVHYINIRGTQEFDREGKLVKHYNRGCSEIEWNNLISKFMDK